MIEHIHHGFGRRARRLPVIAHAAGTGHGKHKADMPRARVRASASRQPGFGGFGVSHRFNPSEKATFFNFQLIKYRFF